MLNFETKVRIESDKLPGVAFTVRRLSKIQRDKITLAALQDQLRVSDLWEQLQKKLEDKDAASEAVRLDAEIGVITSANLKPMYIRAGLVSIEGVQYGGKPATTDLLIENGPDELVDEIWLAINAHAKLTMEQQGNSPSAAASSEAATAAENLTTVAPANG
jgi:hypothetical protein